MRVWILVLGCVAALAFAGSAAGAAGTGRDWSIGDSIAVRYYVARVDAAVDMLASAHIVDPAKVGLIGWSRSSYLNFWTITHPGHTKIAAAIADDSTDEGYEENAEQIVDSGGFEIPETGSSAERTKAAVGFWNTTFWQNKAVWLNEAPDFNVDRVATPMLFTMTNLDEPQGPGFSGAVERVAAFRATHRPFEFLIFPQSSHETRRPREREALMQAGVDWMNFWLEGKAPADSARAARWKRMKADWEQVQKTEQLQK